MGVVIAHGRTAAAAVAKTMEVTVGMFAAAAVDHPVTALGRMEAPHVARTMAPNVGVSAVVVMDLLLQGLVQLLDPPQLPHLVQNGVLLLATSQQLMGLHNCKMEVGPFTAMLVQQQKLPTTWWVAVWSEHRGQCKHLHHLSKHWFRWIPGKQLLRWRS